MLESETVGEVEKEGSVLVIKRIHVVYHLRVDADKRETANRVHDVHAEHCPVYRSIGGCIDITTELKIEAP